MKYKFIEILVQVTKGSLNVTDRLFNYIFLSCRQSNMPPYKYEKCKSLELLKLFSNNKYLNIVFKKNK